MGGQNPLPQFSVPDVIRAWGAAALVLLLGPAVSHAQDVDPRCHTLSARGQIDCIIDQPTVFQHDRVYPEVLFAPGDIVIVNAEGCVRTGGNGNTWKLYVNPPDGGDKYHGLVRIPTATRGTEMVQIRKLVGRPLTVSGIGVGISQLVLHLGYEDDDYSDNGYSDHDKGTFDQCQGEEPARVRISIFRGISPPQPPRFNFNLESTSFAPGGLPLNPHWAWQGRPENKGATKPAAIPETSSLCHDFSRLVNRQWVPDFADCTDQTDLAHVDEPDGFNSAICAYGGGVAFVGHVNWSAVTFQGRAEWGDHNVDDDYSFAFTRDGSPLSVNGRKDLHVEFDSDETIDHFTTREWKAFHDAVDAAEKAKADCRRRPCDPAALRATLALPAKRFDGDTVLTGLFGLDCEHNCKAELHPLFAMATRVDSYVNGGDEVWLMFVRNVGDEGFCSSRLWGAPFGRRYMFRLPWRDQMTEVEVLWGIGQSRFEGTPGTAGPTVTYIPPPSPSYGVYVTFDLPSRTQKPLIEGALHLRWKGEPVITRSAPAATGDVAATGETAREEEVDDAEGGIQAAMDALPAARRTEVENARGPAAPLTLHALPPGGIARRVTVAPTIPPIAVRVDAIGGAARKKQRDASQMRALCAAAGGTPAGLPADTCAAMDGGHR